MLLFTLGAAGVTLLAVLGLLSVPAIDACKGDSRGLVGCMRHLIDQRFDFTTPPVPARPAAEETVPVVAALPEAVAPAEEPDQAAVPATPEVALVVPDAGELPAPPSDEVEFAASDAQVSAPVVPLVVAELPAADVGTEITRSLGPEPGAGRAAFPSAGLPDGAETTTTPAVIPDTIPPLPPLAASEQPDAEPEAAAAPDLPAEPLAAPVLPPPLASVLDAFDPQLLAPPAAETPVLPQPPVSEPVAPDAGEATDPAAAPEPVDVAIADLPPAPAVPEIVAPPVLPPTIDAVEIDGADSFVAGDGPAGALMRLYVDDVLVGESPVEGGRWLVEGVELFTRPSQLLRVDAVEPATGRVLSSTAISFEIELPAPAAEPPAVPEAIAPEADMTPAPDAAGDPEPVAPAGNVPAATVVDVPAAPDQPALPPLRPVLPEGESASVTILGEPTGNALQQLPAARVATDAAAVAIRPPAVIADFEIAAAADSVAVLRAVPYGDPGAGRFVSGKAIIRRGDTLWDIAHRYYGRGIRYDTIYRANRDRIALPSRIYPGQVFDLPLVYDE